MMGSVIASAAFAMCYFAPNVYYLHVFYGVVGGIGFCFIYMPSVIIVGYYFEKWRPLATGIALCGSGVGCFIMAPISTYLIKTFGWRGALLTQAGEKFIKKFSYRKTLFLELFLSIDFVVRSLRNCVSSNRANRRLRHEWRRDSGKEIADGRFTFTGVHESFHWKPIRLFRAKLKPQYVDGNSEQHSLPHRCRDFQRKWSEPRSSPVPNIRSLEPGQHQFNRKKTRTIQASTEEIRARHANWRLPPPHAYLYCTERSSWAWPSWRSRRSWREWEWNTHRQ